MKRFLASSLSSFLAVLLLCAAVPLEAAEGEGGGVAAVVIYAEGEGFSVADSRGRAVEIAVEDAIGRELATGDTVATEQGTFVELQLVPSANIIKVAENTNFTIERRGTPRGGSFSLVYGKVRARVVSLTETDEFSIRGVSAVAGVRGTDFGVSVVLPEEGTKGADSEGSMEPAAAQEPTGAPQAVTDVYCFEGEVEVTRVPSPEEPGESADDGTTAAMPIIVHANEIVSVTRQAEPLEFKTQVLPEDVRSYWETNDFKAEPLPELEAMRIAAAEPAGDEADKIESDEAGASESQAIEKLASSSDADEERPEPIPEAELSQLVRNATTARFEYGALSVALFAIGAVLETAGIVNAVTPGSNVFGDSGVGFMGAGALFIGGGVFAVVQAGRFDREVKKLRSEAGP